MADGQVIFEIKGDPSNVNQTVKQVTDNIQKESKKWGDTASQATGDIEKSFASMAGNIIGSLTAAGIGSILLNWGSAAVEAASDLAEVQNVVDTVFGDGAAKIDSWAKKAGQQFGLTETQAKKFTSTLGAMAKSSGLAGGEIVTMSTDLAGLASDMASFYNMDFETAFEKIRSGISGETMPLKQLGINMSVANLEAFALAQGLEKTFSQMDQGEQTMLRYQYLMQATSDAQGDFSRTADGFANAQRRIQSTIDSIKTNLGTILLPVVENVTSAVANFLAQITATPERTVLDDFNDIDVQTAEKMDKLQETYDKASDIINIIDEISKKTVELKDGSTITFEELFKDIGNVEKNGGDVRGYLEKLGVDVEDVLNKYNQWKESTRQLTSLVPALTSQINSETGAIDGGTEALQKNLDEWKKQQEASILWAAFYAKKRALAASEESIWQLELKVMGAGKAKERIRKTLEDIGTVFDEEGNIDTSKAWWDPSKVAEDFDINKFIDMAADYEDAVSEETRLTDEYTIALANNAKAHQELDDEQAALEERTGMTAEAYENAGEAAEDYQGKSQEAWETSMKGAKEAADAIKAVTDYYKGVRDATEQAVNSTLKGFESIKTVWDQQSDLANQETEALNKYTNVWAKWGSDNAALKKMKEYADNGGKLTAVELEAYEALVKVRNAQKELNDSLDQYRPEGMTAGLESQVAFMEDYLNNLDTLKEWGISDELLASLSDGSKESAEYLKGLAEGGPEAAAGVDELYKKVQEKKKGFTDALTEQKLTIDETYSSLVEKAKEAMEGLDMGEEASNAMGNTVIGIAQGISNNVPAVSAAVDALIAALSPLTNLGFSWGFSDFSFTLEPNGSHANGLDYVPFDGYLARLHEGEGILTAQENAIWQMFKNGHAGNDYNGISSEQLDAILGNNMQGVKAGGNVYLDGRTVGQVISAQQGKSYRQLQRSGWQQ